MSFRSRDVVCAAGHTPPNCLTAGQASAAQMFYQGPVDESGRHLFYGGEPYGSELSWVDVCAAAMGGVMFEDAVKNMIF